MKAKDLLTALKVDATGSLNTLSTMTYVYADLGDKPVNRLHLETAADQIEISYAAKQPALTLKEFVEVLNQHKEAALYLKEQERTMIYGYRLIPDGIVIG